MRKNNGIVFSLRKSSFLIFFILICQFANAQSDSTQLALSEVKIISRDIFETAKWYIKHLGFKVKKSKSREYAILENYNLTLNIVSAKRTVTFSQMRMPENKERINGFYEIGFLASDLDSLLYQYEGRNIRMYKELSYDLEYGRNTVVLSDPDGNRVKLFQATADEKRNISYFKPYFFSITTSDIDTSVRWYKSYLGFQELRNNYSERARISYCLLQKNDLVVELQELSGRTMEITELLSNQIELTRFETVIISNRKKDQLNHFSDSDGNKLAY